MTTPVSTFNLKGMQRAFFVALALNIIAFVTSTVLFFAGDPLGDGAFLANYNPWFLLLMFVGLSILNGISARKVFKYIAEISDPVTRFAAYKKFYNKKMVVNTVTFIATGVLLVITDKPMFLLLMIMQLATCFMFYPRKRLFTTLFPNNEIALA